MLTMFEDDDSVFAAMRAGARGYLVKGAEQDEIARAIRAVAAGEAIFGPGVARRVLGFFAAPRAAADPSPNSPPASARSSTCSPAGLSNTAIADRLNLALKDRRPTTSPRSSPSSRSPTAPRRSSAPATPAWAPTSDRPRNEDGH